jgi:hypothetical protein
MNNNNNKKWLQYLISNTLNISIKNNILSCTGSITITPSEKNPAEIFMSSDQRNNLCRLTSNDTSVYTVDDNSLGNIYIKYKLPYYPLSNVYLFDNFNEKVSKLTFTTITLIPTYDDTDPTLIPMVNLPIKPKNTNVNALVLSKDSINDLIYYSDIIISSNNTNITVSGSIYIPTFVNEDILFTIPDSLTIIEPYLMCDQFSPVLITNIACVNTMFNSTTTNNTHNT